MAYATTNEAIEKLAAAIGENVYIDVAKWHLYLRDAHLHTVLAEQLYPLLQDGKLQENQVLDLLKRIPVKLGGGKLDVPLSELLPMQSQVHLMDVLEEYQREM
ncbi:DUF3181 family protein [Leptolyngbya ohadii]|uniref:DUF3181 family protein n=1 Tax=Leptolyngbya ohadii TaxID=1962290 RepID=UPI000B59C708|nr:DUF3181 family protein [Leptolyngbya ohadii]